MPKIHFAHKLAMLMLLLVAFVVMPVADAAMCGTEEMAAHASDIAADNHAKDDSRDDQSSGHCIHGHCHHNTSSNIPADPIAATDSLWHSLKRASTYEAFASYTPDGLIRPPQA